MNKEGGGGEEGLVCGDASLPQRSMLGTDTAGNKQSAAGQQESILGDLSLLTANDGSICAGRGELQPRQQSYCSLYPPGCSADWDRDGDRKIW